MNYAEARDLIQDGDIIMVTSGNSIYNFLTRAFTGKYTHCGIAIWLDGGLWMAEINGGRNHVIPMSQLANDSFDVYKCPNSVSRVEVRKNILESIRLRTDYGYLAAVIIGINEFFRINMFINWKQIITCGGYVISILDKSGWTGYSYVVSPTKLSKSFNILLEVNHG